MGSKKDRGGNVLVRWVRAGIQFLGEVKGELAKVAWPTKQEVVASTWVVIFAVAVTAVWIFVSDQFASLLINGLVRLIH